MIIAVLLVVILAISMVSAYSFAKAGSVKSKGKASIAGKAVASKDSTTKAKARSISARVVSDVSGKGRLSRFVGKFKAQPTRVVAKRAIGVKALDDAMAPRVR